MQDRDYNPDALYEAERAFAESRNLPADILGKIRDLRMRQAVNLPTNVHKIAAWIVAPVLAGYAGWLAQQAGLYTQPVLLGVMREGRMLCRLINSIGGMPAREIWLNRNLSMLAAFGCGDDEALVNWLVRTRLRPITRAEAERQLFGKAVDGGHATIGAGNVYDFLAEWKASGDLEDARARATALADRLLRHWRDTVGQTNSPVLLMDFACAGNIQRSLRAVFASKGIMDSVVGLNFVTTEGSRWAEKAGCVMRGYLAERGKPEWFAEAYARTPELIEIFAAPPLGPLEGYTESGEIICGSNFLDSSRQQLLSDVQGRLDAWTSLYHRELGQGLEGDTGRCLWGRILIDPLPAEIKALADWPLDAGIEGTQQRELAPALPGPSEAWTKMQTAWPAASRRGTM